MEDRSKRKNKKVQVVLLTDLKVTGANEHCRHGKIKQEGMTEVQPRRSRKTRSAGMLLSMTMLVWRRTTLSRCTFTKIHWFEIEDMAKDGVKRCFFLLERMFVTHDILAKNPRG